MTRKELKAKRQALQEASEAQTERIARMSAELSVNQNWEAVAEAEARLESEARLEAEARRRAKRDPRSEIEKRQERSENRKAFRKRMDDIRRAAKSARDEKWEDERAKRNQREDEIKALPWSDSVKRAFGLIS